MAYGTQGCKSNHFGQNIFGVKKEKELLEEIGKKFVKQ